MRKILCCGLFAACFAMVPQISRGQTTSPQVSGVSGASGGTAGQSKPSAPKAVAAAMTNRDVIRLVTAKISDDVIIAKIRQSKTRFDMSTDGLVALKQAGVSDAVIAVMLNPSASATGAPPSGNTGTTAEASAQAHPTQSQAQSTPPCYDGRPILKRGKQPALPPCPDQPLTASPPADSLPTSSPSPPESLIDRARDAAFEFSEKLPNFICEEFMSRFAQRGREREALDVISAEIVYDNAQESYRNVKINNRPTEQGLQEIGGSWSTGEFASTLLDLFQPDTHAQFRSGGASSISGLSAEVYDFQVRSENSHWKVQAGAQTLYPDYEGSVWVDPQSARVLRVEMQARNIPSSFMMDRVESSVDYSSVMIGGTSFLLPVHAESLGCERGGSDCSHNIIDFRNYHEFKVEIKIGN